MRSLRGAALAGFATCLMQVAGYYVTAEARGFAAGTTYVVFWSACALVGGPLFGAAGRLWSSGSVRHRGLGGAVLPAAFLAEGVWLYGVQLGDYATAAIWLAIGGALSLAFARTARDLRWLAVTVPAGLLGELVLTAIVSRPL